MTLESLGAYRRAGVNVGIGTDSYPFNMLEEMREALICSRVSGRNVFDIDTAGIFRRYDRWSEGARSQRYRAVCQVGAKADLALVDLAIRPCSRSTIRSAT